MQIPPDYYNDDFSNIRYTYIDEAKVINMCHYSDSYGAGSCIEQGFINLASQLDSLIDKTHPPVGLAEEQADEHILGLILASHFPIKKGIALFGKRAEKTTTK